MSQAHFRLPSFPAAFEVSAEQFKPIYSLVMSVCVSETEIERGGLVTMAIWRIFFSFFAILSVSILQMTDNTQSSPTQKEQSESWI